jgi:hypothetical protein
LIKDRQCQDNSEGSWKDIRDFVARRDNILHGMRIYVQIFIISMVISCLSFFILSLSLFLSLSIALFCYLPFKCYVECVRMNTNVKFGELYICVRAARPGGVVSVNFAVVLTTGNHKHYLLYPRSYMVMLTNMYNRNTCRHYSTYYVLY